MIIIKYSKQRAQQIKRNSIKAGNKYMSLDITNSYTNIRNSELISMIMHKLKENE